MVKLIETLGEHTEVMVMLLIAGVIVVATVSKAIVAVVSTASRERTRREIAAYVAEGSMSPDQGERLLRATIQADESEAA